MEEPEESVVTVVTEPDTRSDFDKAFEDDTLHMLQDRMIAKAKTKKFNAEDFIEQARELSEQLDFTDTKASGVETPEPR